MSATVHFREMRAVNFAQRWRSHRQRVRANHSIDRAIDEANTPALRSELIAMANVQFPTYNR